RIAVDGSLCVHRFRIYGTLEGLSPVGDFKATFPLCARTHLQALPL
ncbi:hypothetical protein CEXT_412161, partial [Caerostris extrusa]